MEIPTEQIFCSNRLQSYNPGKKVMAKRQNLRENSIFLGIRKVLNLFIKAEIQASKRKPGRALGAR